MNSSREIQRHLRRMINLLVICSLVGGCGWVPGLPIPGQDVAGTTAEQPVTLTADVVSVDPATGMPRELTGTLSGGMTGTYAEEILEVYFDDSGAPLAALSRSTLTIDSPSAGVLVCMNLVVVSELVMATDSSGALQLDAGGNPLVTGLRSQATGTIVYGDGKWNGSSGDLHSDSLLQFGMGAVGLGALDSELEFNLDSAPAATPEPVWNLFAAAR